MIANPKTFTIFGAGSIGCYVGGRLMHAGQQVHLVARPRMQEVLRSHGLIVSDTDRSKFTINPSELSFDDGSVPADFVFVTVKSHDTESAAIALRGLLDQKTTVVSLQNGVRNAEILRHHLPGHQVIAGMVPFNVVNQGGGHFHRGTEGSIGLEETSASREVMARLILAGIPTCLYKDMKAVQWTKLIMNLNNAVNALSGLPLLQQLRQPSYRRLMAAVIAEALEVLTEAKIQPARLDKVYPKTLPAILRLPTWAFQFVARAMLSMDEDARSSMYEDLANRRRTEIDVLNGEIVVLAKSMGRTAPWNERLVDLIREAEEEGRGSPGLAAQALKP